MKESKVVFLYKGQSFNLIPAIVTLGESESTRSLTLNWEKIYDKVLEGRPVGSELIVGKFTDDKNVEHDVYVERGTGKYFYTIVKDVTP
jgi:hypothetical protein